MTLFQRRDLGRDGRQREMQRLGRLRHVLPLGGDRELRPAAGLNRQGRADLRHLLLKHYGETLDIAATKANSLVAQSLFNRAIKGDGAAATSAAIF